MSERALALRWR